MRAYGVPANDLDGALPWSWAEQRLTRARNYFVASTRADGRPHVVAVWGVWIADRFYFSTAQESVKSRNLSAEPRCAVAIEGAAESVILEGHAERTALDSVEGMEAAYASKYGREHIDIIRAGPVWAVRPTIVLGFVEAPADFSRSATRWRFPQPSTGRR